MAILGRQVDRQNGNIDKILIIVLGLVAAVGTGVFLYMEFRDRKESDPAVHYPNFTPVNEMEDVQFSVWSGTLSCGSEGNWGPFTRDIELLVSRSVVAFETGNVKGFLEATDRGDNIPRELRQRFEFWRGRVSGSQVSLQGWYTEGPNVVKRVSMSGGLTGERILLEGTRGPRRCRIEANPAAVDADANTE